MWLPLHLMLSNDSDKSIQHVVSFWFVRKSYLDCILVEPEEGCQKPQKCCWDNFVIKLTQPLSIIPTGTQGSFFAVSVTECFFLQDKIVGPVPNPQPEGPGDHFLLGPYPSICLAWVALPGVQDCSQHSSPGYWDMQTTLPQ